VSTTCSGSTDALAGVANHTWYDTTNNVITVYGPDGTSVSGTRALPVGIVTVSGGAISSIDKVFNGAGYIGHHAFVLPNTTWFIPNGFNADGTLKSTKHTCSSLSIAEMESEQNCIAHANPANDTLYNRAYLGEYDSQYGLPTNKNFAIAYIRGMNRFSYKGSGSWSIQDNRYCVLVDYSYDGTSVTKFDIRPVSGLSANYINTALGYVPERAEKPLNTLSTSGTISPATNTHNYIAPTGAVTLSLPASPTATIVNEIELQVNQSSAVTFTFGSNVLWGGEGAPDMGVGLWDIIFTWIKGANKWLGSYKKWTTS
jgi:hypothetical protein